MKPFKGSSNKLGPLDSLDKQMYEPLSRGHNDTQPIHKGTEAVLYPIRQAILTPIKVTSNKLEKGPHTELKLEPYSPHSCTISHG